MVLQGVYSVILFFKVFIPPYGSSRYLFCIMVHHGTYSVLWFFKVITLSYRSSRYLLCHMVLQGIYSVLWFLKVLVLHNGSSWYLLCLMVLQGNYSVLSFIKVFNLSNRPSWYFICCCYCCCRPHSTNVLPAESSTRNHVAASSLSPQVARKGSTLSGFVQRSRLEREVGRDLHSNKWEEV